MVNLHRPEESIAIRLFGCIMLLLMVWMYKSIGAKTKGGNYYNCDASTDTYISPWQTRDMTNWVYESEYDYARLCLFEYSGETVSVQVYWNLDI